MVMLIHEGHAKGHLGCSKTLVLSSQRLLRFWVAWREPISSNILHNLRARVTAVLQTSIKLVCMMTKEKHIYSSARNSWGRFRKRDIDVWWNEDALKHNWVLEVLQTCILIVELLFLIIQGFTAHHITNLCKVMRELSNPLKSKQSHLDFIAQISRCMFIFVPICLTVYTFPPCTEKWSSPALILLPATQDVAPKRSKISVCVHVLYAVSIVAARHSFEMCFA